MAISNLKDNCFDGKVKDKDTCLSKISHDINITTKRLSGSYHLISMKGDLDKRISSDELILEVWKDNKDDKYHYKTGNWAGILQIKKKNTSASKQVAVTIESRFGNNFLARMLNYANDIFIDDIQEIENEKSANNPFQFVLAYLFIKSLEKATLGGLPSQYKDEREDCLKFRGKVNFTNFMKKDIPFQGKISNIHRERKAITEIINVLAHALSIVKNDYKMQVLPRINTLLKENKTVSFANSAIQNIAKNHSVLANPMFKDYKKALEWGCHIINHKGISDNKDNDKKLGCAYLFNIAELFEIYLLKLIRKNFPDWEVSSPKITTYKGQFFERFIIPDIVMEDKNSNRVIVFDAKYKKMQFKGKNNSKYYDLDRNDFFQIHTYISYYESIDKEVIAGGLLYPIEVTKDEFDKENNKMSETLFGGESKNKTNFIVDGIVIPEEFWKEEESQNEDKGNLDKLIESENDFIKRIEYLIESANNAE
ncbi:MAG: hypothetical protein U9Q83_09530 [Bacteroidota bacterium]|nr:hypothetical protein [Bacteroidota bacterium]